MPRTTRGRKAAAVKAEPVPAEEQPVPTNGWPKPEQNVEEPTVEEQAVEEPQEEEPEEEPVESEQPVEVENTGDSQEKVKQSHPCPLYQKLTRLFLSKLGKMAFFDISCDRNQRQNSWAFKCVINDRFLCHEIAELKKQKAQEAFAAYVFNYYGCQDTENEEQLNSAMIQMRFFNAAAQVNKCLPRSLFHVENLEVNKYTCGFLMNGQLEHTATAANFAQARDECALKVLKDDRFKQNYINYLESGMLPDSIMQNPTNNNGNFTMSENTNNGMMVTMQQQVSGIVYTTELLAQHYGSNLDPLPNSKVNQLLQTGKIHDVDYQMIGEPNDAIKQIQLVTREWSTIGAGKTKKIARMNASQAFCMWFNGCNPTIDVDRKKNADPKSHSDPRHRLSNLARFISGSDGALAWAFDEHKDEATNAVTHTARCSFDNIDGEASGKSRKEAKLACSEYLISAWEQRAGKTFEQVKTEKKKENAELRKDRKRAAVAAGETVEMQDGEPAAKHANWQ